ncbi:MAG TPA: FtsX-like permease family protein [Streptosporangiaceae bacterium]|nr:FtsX-like permease family protein [Streptosporangiaceae bacterium]
MSVTLEERPAAARARNGGVPARRAVIRWAWRLLRREWRQQLLILALITVAVAATFVGSAVATNTPVPPGAGFGTANKLATFGSLTPHVSAEIAELGRRFGPVDVIENETFAVPGSISTYSLRAQNPRGPFGRPMLSLVSGHFPAGAGQVALTSGVASDLQLGVGGTWRAGGQARRVVGIVANPQNLADQFALVAPGQVAAPSLITVLFDATPAQAGSLGSLLRSVSARGMAAPNVINPVTISLAAATLGMLLIALVGVGGFTVLAQRRLRAIGMLGAQGATNANVGLVISANGFATGVVGAGAGFAVGLVAWLAYRPHAEASAHHVMGAFHLPWLVIFISMGLAVAAAYLAALRPARAIARLPVIAALAGRPPAPRAARRWGGPAGVGLLVAAFFLIGFASEQATSHAAENGEKSTLFLALVAGLVILCAGVVLAAPGCLALLARIGRRAPVVVRLALRDLARYRARSGAALGAISISVLIAVIICVVAAARFGSAIDYVGPNLAADQLVIYPQLAYTTPNAPCLHEPSGCPALTRAQLATMAARARVIGASLGSRNVIHLETTDSVLLRAAAGRTWNGPVYVATPQLLRAYGIAAAQVSPDADILTMRPGLSTTTKMRLMFGAVKFGPPAPGAPCLPSECLANPKIEEIGALPSGISAPNTVITLSAVRRLHLTVSTVGWLVQVPGSVTASQLSAAQHAAVTAGLIVESRDSIPTFSEILDAATAFGIVLALGILAMSVGLVSSETATNLRTLTATGASGSARRAITAATAGALALTGAFAGLVAGYVASIAFFRASQLDNLSALTSIPVANLLLILVGMPLIAVAGGWLLAGREPKNIGRLPLE